MYITDGVEDTDTETSGKHIISQNYAPDYTLHTLNIGNVLPFPVIMANDWIRKTETCNWNYQWTCQLEK